MNPAGAGTVAKVPAVMLVIVVRVRVLVMVAGPVWPVGGTPVGVIVTVTLDGVT